MFEVTGGQTDATWESIIASPTNRANFISQLKTIMLGGAGTADDIEGFNFDWERPNTAAEWGNYTQLARELRTAFEDPLTPTTNNWEISVCDYGSTDSGWDDTTHVRCEGVRPVDDDGLPHRRNVVGYLGKHEADAHTARRGKGVFGRSNHDRRRHLGRRCDLRTDC